MSLELSTLPKDGPRLGGASLFFDAPSSPLSEAPCNTRFQQKKKKNEDGDRRRGVTKDATIKYGIVIRTHDTLQNQVSHHVYTAYLVLITTQGDLFRSVLTLQLTLSEPQSGFGDKLTLIPSNLSRTGKRAVSHGGQTAVSCSYVASLEGCTYLQRTTANRQ